MNLFVLPTKYSLQKYENMQLVAQTAQPLNDIVYFGLGNALQMGGLYDSLLQSNFEAKWVNRIAKIVDKCSAFIRAL